MMKKQLFFGLTVGLMLSTLAISARDVEFRGGIMDEEDVRKVEEYERKLPSLWKRAMAAMGWTKKLPVTPEQDIAKKPFYHVINETSRPISARTPLHTVRDIMPNDFAQVFHMDKQRIAVKKMGSGSWTDFLRTKSHILRVVEKPDGRIEILQTDSQGKTFFYVENRTDIPINVISDKEGELIAPGKFARVDREEPEIKITTQETDRKDRRTFRVKTLNHFVRIKKDRTGSIKVQTKP
ncbi:hypothetical protein ACFLX2_00435 [Candidatus Dependentiae bacterium]